MLPWVAITPQTIKINAIAHGLDDIPIDHGVKIFPINCLRRREKPDQIKTGIFRKGSYLVVFPCNIRVMVGQEYINRQYFIAFGVMSGFG